LANHKRIKSTNGNKTCIDLERQKFATFKIRMGSEKKILKDYRTGMKKTGADRGAHMGIDLTRPNPSNVRIPFFSILRKKSV